MRRFGVSQLQIFGRRRTIGKGKARLRSGRFAFIRSLVRILETDRLVLRELEADDGAFLHALMNDPAWLRYIGDKGIRTVEDARSYIVHGAQGMYARDGFGLWLVSLKESGRPIGICGLIKRDALEDIDLGFAFLPAYRRQGFASEAARATIAHGKEKLGLHRLVAIMSPENEASGQLLEKLGFRFERMIRLTAETPEIKLFALVL